MWLLETVLRQRQRVCRWLRIFSRRRSGKAAYQTSADQPAFADNPTFLLPVLIESLPLKINARVQTKSLATNKK
jgi:hypothetical protein